MMLSFLRKNDMKNRYRYSPDEYYGRIYDTHASPFENLTEKADYAVKCEEIRQKIGDTLAIENIPLKIDKLKPEILKTESRKNYSVSTMSVEICEGLNMLCYVLEPKGKVKSGIVAFCGHGYGCRQIIRQSKRGKYRILNFLDNYQKNFAGALAENGHLVIVPEPIGFGEAKLKKDFVKPFYSSSCDTLSHHSLLYGFSAASMRVYQVRRCIDILEQKYSINEIGIMGISGGGLVALYSSCVDARISKTCVCGYINTFRTSVLRMWHCPDNYIPGLLKIGDMYDFASALAPKKLMMEFGTDDKLFPIEGSRLARDKIAAVYDAAGCSENFFGVEFKGKHEVYLPEALKFFDEGGKEK